MTSVTRSKHARRDATHSREEAVNLLSKPSPVLVVVVSALTLAGCGVSKTKYAEVQSTVQKLETENQKLQSDLSAANTKGADLEKQVATMKDNQASMQALTDSLHTDLEKQKQDKAQAEATYQGLVGQLQSEISSGKVEIEKVLDGIRVNLAQDILFKSGSANLDPSGKALLVKVCDELKDPKYEVMVIGHTDDQKIGAALQSKYPTNWELGAARSAQIVRLLTDNGVSPSHVAVVSAGQSRPRADNSTPEGRAQNRRIEIRMRPTEVMEPAAAAQPSN
jgi:chemotaxis protein MotB